MGNRDAANHPQPRQGRKRLNRDTILPPLPGLTGDNAPSFPTAHAVGYSLPPLPGLDVAFVFSPPDLCRYQWVKPLAIHRRPYRG